MTHYMEAESKKYELKFPPFNGIVAGTQRSIFCAICLVIKAEQWKTGVEIFIVESTGNNRESRNDLHSIWRFFIWQDLHYREIYTMEREHSKP